MDFEREKPPRRGSRSSRGAGPGAENGSRPKDADASASGRGERRRVPLGRLTRRAEFLRVRGGRSWRASSFVLVSRPRPVSEGVEAGVARFGFTVTKRIGTAVRRNRARRRLREAVRLTAPGLAEPGFDYVVIARGGAVEQAFATLLEEFETAFDRLHGRTPGARPATSL